MAERGLVGIDIIAQYGTADGVDVGGNLVRPDGVLGEGGHLADLALDARHLPDGEAGKRQDKHDKHTEAAVEAAFDSETEKGHHRAVPHYES